MQRYTSGSSLRASAAQTAGTVYTPQQRGKGTVGLKVVVSITGAVTGTLTATIEEFNPANNTWRTLLASAALNAAGDTVLRVDPRSAAVANQIAQEIAPKRWRLKGVVATGPITWGAHATYG